MKWQVVASSEFCISKICLVSCSSGRVGKEKQAQTLVQNKHTVLSVFDKTEEVHNTQKVIAEELNWSTGKKAQADVKHKHAPELV